MLYDYLELDRESREPLCHQLYEGIRRAVEMGRVNPGEKLPSIRQAAAELTLSRTTVETAYGRLCMEGYVRARPQSGYRVQKRPRHLTPAAAPAAAKPRYDFTTAAVEPLGADLENWRRLMRRVLADEAALTAYGDPQGEPALRQALAPYIFRARGVTAEPDAIFIGAGVGPLLQLLCPLLPDRPAVRMEAPGFLQARQIFEDYGFSVSVGGGLPEGEAGVAMELPSLRPVLSSSAAAARRQTLCRWVDGSPRRLILEDDYNGELRYRTRPTPAFQAVRPDKTVYLGSFSKLLVPSVRVAYMVLPPALAAKARQRLATANQTAGKTEQAALAEYIRQGLLEKHLRRLRRLYGRKSQLLGESLSRLTPYGVTACLQETSLSFTVTVPGTGDSFALAAAARRNGIACTPVPDGPGSPARLILGFSGIPEEAIGRGVEALESAWLPYLERKPIDNPGEG